MVGASGQLYSVDFHGKRLLFWLVVVVVMMVMGVVTGVIQGHESIQGHKQRGLSPSQLRKPLTATPLARIPVFSVVWALHSSWRWRGRAKQTTIRSPALSDIRVDETRDVYFPFVVMWIQRRQVAGYTAPDDDEGVASRAKAPAVLAWQPRGEIKAGTRLHQTDGAASRDLPLLISLILINELHRGTEVVSRHLRQDSLWSVGG